MDLYRLIIRSMYKNPWLGQGQATAMDWTVQTDV